MNERLLNTRDVLGVYGISRTSLFRRIKTNQVPHPVSINGRNFWSSALIDRHIAELTGKSL